MSPASIASVARFISPSGRSAFKWLRGAVLVERLDDDGLQCFGNLVGAGTEASARAASLRTVRTESTSTGVSSGTRMRGSTSANAPTAASRSSGSGSVSTVWITGPELATGNPCNSDTAVARAIAGCDASPASCIKVALGAGVPRRPAWIASP